MRWWRAAGAVAVGAAAVVWACGGAGSGDVGPGRDGGPPLTDGGDPDSGHPDAGPPDAGPDAGPPDAGPPDAGPPDAGPPDAGPPDGGFDPPPAIPFPTVPGWSFLGPQHGGPHDVFQVSADQGGNIWVAGGADGLFLLRPGATKFERFTIADGLHPYGYLNGDQAKFLGVPNGTPADPSPSLSATPVIAVEGGPPGVVFVGYQGKGYPGKDGCEDNWDTVHKPGPLFGDPTIYKSGDADRVTLDASGKLKVVHYDIFSGPGIVTNEKEGREKLCSVFRIIWNSATNDLWFGGNHGFAWGDPSYAGNPTCNGIRNCSGVVEHAHPAFNGCTNDADCGPWAWITEDYRGIAVDPSGDVWFGGAARTTRFHWSTFGGSLGSRFDAAASLTEDPGSGGTCPQNAFPCFVKNRIDVWRDMKDESTTTAPYPGQRVDDLVFGLVAMPDGSGVWVGSGYLGLRTLAADGSPAADLSSRVASSYTYTKTFKNPDPRVAPMTVSYPAAFVGALALDSLDGKTLWVGNRYGNGIDRLDLANPRADQHYALDVFGSLANSWIEDIHLMGSGASRKVLVGFRQTGNTPGFVAIYSGP
jgi:hypothetical protein